MDTRPPAGWDDATLQTRDPRSRSNDALVLRENRAGDSSAASVGISSLSSVGRHRDPQSHKRWRRSILVLATLMGVGAGSIGAQIFLMEPIESPPAGAHSTPTSSTQRNATTFPPTAIAEVAILTASEDVSVNAEKPDEPAGHNPILRVDGTPQVISYLKFKLENVGDRVTRLVLMLYSTTGSQEGFSVHIVDHSNWDQSTVTFANAPPIGEEIGVSGSFRANSIVQVELDSFVAGVGEYSLALVSKSRTLIGFASLDSDISRPQLLVRTERMP